MSSTRRASKRDRLARRAENDQMRYARRETLLILLSRTQRGITLSAAEAGVLRVHVEAEIREGDDARTGERGQQRAMEQQRQRVDAAEAAIVEAEQRAEALLQRAERAEQDRAALATELHAVRARAENTEAGDTAALNLTQSTIRQWKARAQEAEGQAATQLNRARMWRQKAIETDDRADRYKAAWKSARQRAAEQRTLADSRQERLSIRARRIIELEQRAARAEQRTEWAERHVSSTARALARGDRYRAAWHSARDRSRKHATEEKRVRGWLEHWSDRARTAEQALAEAAPTAKAWEHAARRYAASLDAARDRADTIRRYVEAVYAADMAEGVREDLRRLLDGKPPTYGAPRTPERAPEQPEPAERRSSND